MIIAWLICLQLLFEFFEKIKHSSVTKSKFTKNVEGDVCMISKLCYLFYFSNKKVVL